MKSCLISLIYILVIIKDGYTAEVEVKLGDPIQLCCGLKFDESDGLVILSDIIRLAVLFQKKVNEIDISKFREKFPKYSDIKISLINAQLCLTKDTSSAENDNFSIKCQVNKGGMFETLSEETIVMRVYEELKFTKKLNDSIAAPIGKPLVVLCEASGSPDLQVLWRNEEKGKLISGTSSASLTIDNITSDMNQKQYICEASTSIPKNKAASVINQKITLNVLFAPEINVDMSIIHTDLGIAEEVNITVKGNPRPKFECQLLNLQAVSIASISTISPFTYVWKMEFLNISQNHIKDYDCIATNTQGEARTTITLNLIPGNLKITSDNSTSYSNYYPLTWELNSKSTIKNVTVAIAIIKAADPSTERFEILQEKELESCQRPPNNKENKWKKSFLHSLVNLTGDVLYKISLKACNRHGCADSANLAYVTTPVDNGQNKFDSTRSDLVHFPGNLAPIMRWRPGFLFFVTQSTAIVFLPLVSHQLY